MQSGDQVLANHLQLGGRRRNVLYTSKTIHNEFIHVCGLIIRTFILTEVRAAPFFSIIQQMTSSLLSVCNMSILYSSRTIEKGFIGLSECLTGMSAIERLL